MTLTHSYLHDMHETSLAYFSAAAFYTKITNKRKHRWITNLIGRACYYQNIK